MERLKSILICVIAGLFLIIITLQGMITPPVLPPQVGDIITFGPYRWIILDVAENKKLLLSRDILYIEQFHHSDFLYGGWDSSGMRQYFLHQVFINSFNEEERDRMAVAYVQTPQNPWFEDSRASLTSRDLIFLLSIDEVTKYFGDSGRADSRPTFSGGFLADYYNEARQARYNGRAMLMRGGTPFMYAGVRPAVWIYLENEV